MLGRWDWVCWGGEAGYAGGGGAGYAGEVGLGMLGRWGWVCSGGGVGYAREVRRGGRGSGPVETCAVKLNSWACVAASLHVCRHSLCATDERLIGSASAGSRTAHTASRSTARRSPPGCPSTSSPNSRQVISLSLSLSLSVSVSLSLSLSVSLSLCVPQPALHTRSIKRIRGTKSK